MTKEEKLQEAKRLYKTANADQRYVLESLFPELRESEDEKIRKEIVDYINRLTVTPNNIDRYNSWIAWLEKQGKQKPTKPIWKYKKDHTPLLRDSLILNKYGCVAKSPSGAIVSDVWVIDYDELAKLPKEELEKQDEQKPADKVEKFKAGDWVVVSTTKEDRVVQIASVQYFTKDGYPSYITTEGRWFGNGTKARLLTDKDVEIATIPESKIIVKKTSQRQ